MLWTSAIMACTALVLITVLQMWIQLARPESATPQQQVAFSKLQFWLGSFISISSQAILVSIGLAIAGIGLTYTRRMAPQPAAEAHPTASWNATSANLPPAEPAKKIVIK